MKFCKMTGCLVLAGISLFLGCILTYLWGEGITKPEITSLEETVLILVAAWLCAIIFLRSLGALLSLLGKRREMDSHVYSEDIYGVRWIIPFCELAKRSERINGNL